MCYMYVFYIPLDDVLENVVFCRALSFRGNLTRVLQSETYMIFFFKLTIDYLHFNN